MIKKMLKRFRKLIEAPNIFCYVQTFKENDQFINHYFRACWYLPKYENIKIIFFTKLSKPSIDDLPAYFCSDFNKDTSHIILVHPNLKFFYFLFATVFISWDQKRTVSFIKNKAINLDTNDLDSKEYGKYASLIWKYYLSSKDRKEILKSSFKNFERIRKKIISNKYESTVIFGTGPSLDSSTKFNFENRLTIVCNSVVKNIELLNHIKPDFICAGDVVSHIGVSKYAQIFREDLEKHILNSDSYFLTTASFGFTLYQNYPKLRSKIILIEQRKDSSSVDLNDQFELPTLDSTLNIHMFPIAYTFNNDIYITGCDGKLPNDRDNEDFWAHSKHSQYLELVNTGHLCHPTFDIHRQLSTFNRFNESCIKSISKAHLKNLSLKLLTKSYIPAFKDLHMNEKELREKGFLDEN